MKQIEQIMETTGTVMNGVLTLEQDRTDLHVIGPHGLLWKPPCWSSTATRDRCISHRCLRAAWHNGQAVCAPDYALIASEINPALGVSRAEGFEVHCLYNQETAEQPQLYFSHNLAVGNAIDLAHKVSKVLDKLTYALEALVPPLDEHLLLTRSLPHYAAGHESAYEEGQRPLRVLSLKSPRGIITL